MFCNFFISFVYTFNCLYDCYIFFLFIRFVCTSYLFIVPMRLRGFSFCIKSNDSSKFYIEIACFRSFHVKKICALLYHALSLLDSIFHRKSINCMYFFSFTLFLLRHFHFPHSAESWSLAEFNAALHFVTRAKK